MEKAKILEQLIAERNLSLKAFAEKCNIPYTTLYTIIKNGAGKANVNNVIPICKELGISVEQLDNLSKDIKVSTKDDNYNSSSKKSLDELIEEEDKKQKLEKEKLEKLLEEEDKKQKLEREKLEKILEEEDKKQYAKIAGYGGGVKTIEINAKEKYYYALIKNDIEGYKKIDMTKEEFIKIRDMLDILRK